MTYNAANHQREIDTVPARFFKSHVRTCVLWLLLRLLVQYGGQWRKRPEARANSVRHLLAVRCHRAATGEDLDRPDRVGVCGGAVLWGGGHTEGSTGRSGPRVRQHPRQPKSSH